MYFVLSKNLPCYFSDLCSMIIFVILFLILNYFMHNYFVQCLIILASELLGNSHLLLMVSADSHLWWLISIGVW